MLALIVERQIKLKIRVFSKINCHSICTYGSQNLSVSISHIRGLGALKQLTKVYYSFNNDYHYEMSVSKPYKIKNKNKANCRTTKKTNYTEFSPYAKTKDNGGHNKNNNDNDIDNNDNNNNYHYCYYNNNNNNSTNDRKLIKQKPKNTTKNKFKETEKNKKFYS